MNTTTDDADSLPGPNAGLGDLEASVLLGPLVRPLENARIVALIPPLKNTTAEAPGEIHYVHPVIRDDVQRRLALKEGVGKEIQGLIAAVQFDPDYAWVWQCNLAMPIMDIGVSHEKANEAAARIMQLFFGVDMTKHPHYPKAPVDEPINSGGCAPPVY